MRFLRPYLLFGIALVACGGRLPGARTDVVGAAADDGFRQYSALRAAGYNYKIAGQVSAMTVSRTPGDTTHLSLVPGPAGLTVSLVRSPKRILELTLDRSMRSASSQVVGCTDDCNAAGAPTPAPRATPPPNYSACTSIGGATFFDDDTGSGGCLPAGQTKSWSCGSWTWSSRGKGRYRSWDGLADINDISYVTVSDGGSACHIGW